MKVPRQPEINIGMVGHVDHGKTTLTERLSGEWTDRHSEEVKRGISIRLGYADTAVYKCPDCPAPKNYSVMKKCPHCGGKTKLQRAISFVDSPGHETLMATMLSGAAIMDGALLLIAANEHCPQLQTKEHLMALEISGVKNIIIVQNKVDLVTPEEAKANYEEIKAFVSGTCAENSPIIPISAHHEMNIDVLLGAMEEIIPTPTYDEKAPARLYIARSFDVNKPGTGPEDLLGGVIGGSLMQGLLRIGDEIEIRPGRKISEHGRIKYKNIYTKISSLVSGQKQFKRVRPSGLIGIGTTLDPYLSKSDSLTGTMAGSPDTLPPMRESVIMEINLLEFVIGSAEDIKVEEIKVREPLMISVGTATTVGIVMALKENVAEVRLKLPICAEIGARMAISRRIGNRWRLIGYAIIKEEMD